MKIAISSTGPTLESDIDERFGRCPYFIIVKTEGSTYKLSESIKNDAAERSGGAGSFAAKLVAQKGVGAVLTGELGPNAKEVLDQFKIRSYVAKGKIRSALKNILATKIKD